MTKHEIGYLLLFFAGFFGCIGWSTHKRTTRLFLILMGIGLGAFLVSYFGG